MAARDDNEQAFTRRAILLGGGGGLVFSALVTRLYYLQVVRAQDYATLSDNNRFNFRTIVPARGRILDRNGEEIAGNRQDFRVVIIPERIDDIDVTLDRLSRNITLSGKSRERIKKDIRKKRKFTPILIKEHLSWEDFAALNLDLPNLPGVVPLSGETRNYPKNGAFSHITGFVGTPSPQDTARDKDPLLRQPTFQIGKIGVERGADARLRGAAGKLKVEVNAFGRVVREWPDPNDAAVRGEDVYLTLDSRLQNFTAELYGEESGGAALMDVKTGELRALLSMPLY
ncbi:MAG: penicillin-binding protein 2, partial [Robiginitomaculum sp.]